MCAELVGKRKIIIMSKLAVYEKRDAAKDLRKCAYYRHDYVYKKNMGLRLSYIIGAAILIVFYMMHKFALDGADIFALDIPNEIRTLIIIVVAMAVAATLLGTVKHNLEYEAAMKRLRRYQTLLNLLDKDGAKQAREAERAERSTADNGPRPIASHTSRYQRS